MINILKMKEKYTKENLEKVITCSSSIREVCRNMDMAQTGRNTVTIKKYIKLHGINTEHFLTKEETLKKIHRNNTIPIHEVFIEDSKYNNSTGIKKKIRDNNLIGYKCSICKNSGEWENKKLSLQLDHINGVNDDNRIENLRFLCPNCHSQTETFCGKHKGKKQLKAKQRLSNGGHTDKEILYHIKNRKVERPSKDLLVEQLNRGNFRSVGKLYGVTDNTIRKWCKHYDLPTTSKNYKIK